MQSPIKSDIYIATQCASAAINAAVGDLALIPVTDPRAESATVMLIIADDYLSRIGALVAPPDDTPAPSLSSLIRGSITAPDSGSSI